MRLFFLIILSAFQLSNAQDTLPLFNPELPVELRIDDLIKRLTLKEKASLMLHNNPAIERLGIPEYNWWNECLHGVGRAGKATVFPQATGLAASFDEDLLFRVATAISDEARAKHNEALKKNSRLQYTGLSFWTPNVNIFRDPRWGRGQETYGEDPYLTSSLGVAFVKGLQGNNPKYLKTAACAKHFAVHSGPEESRHHFNVLPESRDFRETYLPAFKSLSDAGVEAIMCAYNRVYDEPCCGSNLLLKKILRDEWKFQGHIVSDCWALDDFWLRHKVTETQVESAVLAANAGVNLNCGYIYGYLPEAVEKGLIPESLVDENLRPVLRTRFKLGLFDPIGMNPYDTLSAGIVNCKKHKALALESACKSMVLLKNKNNILPLDKSKIKSLFVSGPAAANFEVLVGNYNGFSGEMVTVLEGIVNRCDAGTVVDYSMGCLFNTDSVFHGEWQAGYAEVTIAVIGLSRLLEGENGDAMLSDHGGDRKEIGLPANQIEFIRKMRKAAGEKPLIVVITAGSAVSVPEIAEMADALIYAWYPGEQGGNAVADVIFGNYNPAGRLPVTIYEKTTDLPAFDDYSMENRTYRYFKGKPLYPFGFGLSYTKFDYSDLKTDKSSYNTKNDTIKIKVLVKNSGITDGEEVIQLYIKNITSKEKMPNKMLKGFKRLPIKTGKQDIIEFNVPVKSLEIWNETKQQYEILKGKYELQAASSSEDVKQKLIIEIK
ncbi:MAG TPA: glycosyl hydrolase [Bacteroidales bacterium]|nr:glycosyl hydrolase [Bacteroidales bacterium]